MLKKGPITLAIGSRVRVEVFRPRPQSEATRPRGRPAATGTPLSEPGLRLEMR